LRVKQLYGFAHKYYNDLKKISKFNCRVFEMMGRNILKAGQHNAEQASLKKNGQGKPL
jgi:hypothetical protein